jgi:hypothetical protein
MHPIKPYLNISSTILQNGKTIFSLINNHWGGLVSFGIAIPSMGESYANAIPLGVAKYNLKYHLTNLFLYDLPHFNCLTTNQFHKIQTFSQLTEVDL